MQILGLDWQLIDSYITIGEQSANPSGGQIIPNTVKVYAKDNGSGVSQLCYQVDNGTVVCMPTSGSIVTGSGTANKLAMWTGTTTLGNLSNTLTQHRVLVADANGLPVNNAALTTGQVVFPDANGELTGDATLFWDNTNKRLLSGTINGSVDRALVVGLSGSATQPVGIHNYSGGAATPINGIVFRSARGSAASPTAVQADDTGVVLAFQGWGTTGFTGSRRAAITMRPSENWSDTLQGAYLTIETTTTGGTTTAERLRIEASGDISAASGSRFRMLSQNRIRYLNSLVHVTNSADITLTTSTWTVLTWDTETFDTDTMHSTVSNTSRLTAQIAGKYRITLNGGFAAAASAMRFMSIEKNANAVEGGGTILALESRTPDPTVGNTTYASLSCIANLAANDYVEGFAWQDSGANLAFTHGGFINFSMYYIGE